MPNWVRTRLTFNGEQSRIDELKAFVKSETKDESGELHTNLFDFNKVVPMPEELNIESGSSGDWGMRYLLLNAKSSFLWTDDDRSFMERMEKQKEENPDRFNEDIELGKKYLSNISKYEYKDWYNWACANWNTKWNACEVEWISDNCVEFETAWSFCFPIVEKLSEMFPTLTIEAEWSDEDAGSNTGSIEIRNKVYIRENYPDNGSNEAYKLYKELWGCDDIAYDEETDSYKWIDEN